MSKNSDYDKENFEKESKNGKKVKKYMNAYLIFSKEQLEIFKSSNSKVTHEKKLKIINKILSNIYNLIP